MQGADIFLRTIGLKPWYTSPTSTCSHAEWQCCQTSMLKAGTYVTCLDDDLQLIMWMLESFPFIWQRQSKKKICSALLALPRGKETFHLCRIMG